MTKNESIKYLSLKTAAQMYGYTRDHLGLMIRQGKLKGIKLGSYYVTTGDSMAEYIEKFADPNHPAMKNKLSNKFTRKILSYKKESPGEPVMAVAESPRVFEKPKASESKTVESARPAPPEAFRNNSRSNFEKLILEDLSYFKSASQDKPTVSDFSGQSRAMSDSSLTILPIRKMEHDERMKIIEKAGRKKADNDWEDDDY